MMRASICTAAILLAFGILHADPNVGNGDVWIRLNGGANEVLLDANNTLEIQIGNDATLTTLSMGFEIEWNPLVEIALSGEFGDRPPVQQHNGAADAFTVSFAANDRFDDISPDSIHISGVALLGGLPASGLRLCYSMQFYASSSSQTDLVNGFCVDNIVFPPSGSWLFADAGGYYAPDFNGWPNQTTEIPNAPPICFDVVHASNICGDCDASAGVDIDDVVYLIAYIFSGGSEPVPYESGDADCSGGVDIDDVVYLIAYIFSGGYAPCDPDGDGGPDC